MSKKLAVKLSLLNTSEIAEVLTYLIKESTDERRTQYVRRSQLPMEVQKKSMLKRKNANKSRQTRSICPEILFCPNDSQVHQTIMCRIGRRYT